MESKAGKVGRPKLIIDENKLKEEITKYLNGEQTGVKTYTNLDVGKTTFYKLLKERNCKRANFKS